MLNIYTPGRMPVKFIPFTFRAKLTTEEHDARNEVHYQHAEPFKAASSLRIMNKNSSIDRAVSNRSTRVVIAKHGQRSPTFNAELSIDDGVRKTRPLNRPGSRNSDDVSGA